MITPVALLALLSCKEPRPADDVAAGDTDTVTDTDTGADATAPALAACAASGVGFDLPAAASDAPWVRFDGEGLSVVWNQLIDSVLVPFAATWSCDGILLAGPVQLGAGLSLPYVAGLAPVDGGAVVLLGDEGGFDPNYDSRAYVQRVSVDLTSLSAPEALAPADASSYPYGIVVHGDQIAAAVSSESAAGRDVAFHAVGEDGTAAGELARYATTATTIPSLELASGDALQAAWIEYRDGVGFSVIRTAVGAEKEVVDEGGMRELQFAASGDRSVLAYLDGSESVLVDEAGTRLVIDELGRDSCDVGLSPEGGLCLQLKRYESEHHLVRFDDELASYEVGGTVSLPKASDPQYLADDTWLVRGWNESTTAGRVEFLRISD
jgi:hypothetical protein